MKFNNSSSEAPIIRASNTKSSKRIRFWVSIIALPFTCPFIFTQSPIISKFPIAGYPNTPRQNNNPIIIRTKKRIFCIFTPHQFSIIIYPIKAKLFLSPHQTSLLKLTRHKVCKNLSPIRLNYNNKCLISLKQLI